MASNKLFSLFDEKLRSPDELVSVPAQSLSSMQHDIESSGTLLNKIRQFENVKLKVDYSDFTNFVFFNSALDYFNITGEKILNEFPYDGTRDSVEQFVSNLDGYETYTYNSWPKNTGYLSFASSSNFSYVRVDDAGSIENVSTTSLLSPANKSFSVDFWVTTPAALTGSTDCMVIIQKQSGSSGLSAFFSGSTINFSVSNGINTYSISASFTPQETCYYSLVCDRDQPSLVNLFDLVVLKIYKGDSDQFPYLLASSSAYPSAGTFSVDVGTEPLFMGSGSLASKATVAPKFAIDDVRFWKTALSIAYFSSSFNAKIFSSENLYGLWRFNEAPSGSIASDTEAAFIRDDSGKKLNGTIKNYSANVRTEGTLLPYDEPDLIRSLNASEVSEYIVAQQETAFLFDKTNDNQITKLMPEQFFILEEYKGSNVLKNFLFLIGRYFDQMKVSIDQFAHILKTDYSNYNQAPDALLEDIAKFFGWQFTGNFLDSSVIQYIIGKDVLENVQGNKQLDKKLYEIKNEFWKRTLINLMHLYKTKGTRESVESLMRIYGVNKNFVKLKEFGIKQNTGVSTTRIYSEKSVPALSFGTSASYASEVVVSPHFSGNIRTIEARLRFPTEISSGMTASFTAGSIWSICSGTSETIASRLYYTKAVASTTGTLIYSASEGQLELSGAPIFDNEWYNVTVTLDHTESNLNVTTINVKSIDRDEIDFETTASFVVSSLTGSYDNVFKLGRASASIPSPQMWVQEVKLWDQTLDEDELDDHALNFQSFGTKEINGLETLFFHWRLDENVSSSISGQLSEMYDNSGNNLHPSGSGFQPSTNVYKKFLNEFNYIASPEFGWSEEKIRDIEGSVITPENQFSDSSLLSLEFNVVDALNEDISQILSTLDSFNEVIGAPVNRYRDEYQDLNTLRNNYFNRLQGSVNFTKFADMLEFFDRSFIDMIRRLLPARSIFIGDELVVESHILERPKLQWNYRRRDIQFEPEGVIKVLLR